MDDPSDGRVDGAAFLPASVTSALRPWLAEQYRAHRSTGGSISAIRADEATRRAMRQLCDAAHQHGVRVEQLIVLVKQLWATLPATAGAEDRHAAREALDGIVWVCIEEFYAPAKRATDAAIGDSSSGSAAGRGSEHNAIRQERR